MPYLGCHLSSSAGFLSMGEAALQIGADTFQFFTRNPRGGKAKPLDRADAASLLRLMEAHGFGPVIAHAPYTINPCSAAPETREFAKSTMADDLLRMEALPGQYYNFHPGSHVGQGTEAGICLISGMLNEIMTGEQTTTVLLETMAGKGSEVGGRFEELRELLDRAAVPEKLGVCLDTCHVYDAGYDIARDLDGVLTEFDRVIGLSRLKALHLNDSKNPFSSHKDRHEKLGQGSLGLEAFQRIVTNPALQGLPMVLETPNELPGYALEIALLRAVLS
ncbi:MAG: deoxyribonuclease IV [Oscillospiraceae bacterium]|nr:deoxyribonuclease IV [Oscillospiraceae bacterium]